SLRAVFMLWFRFADGPTPSRAPGLSIFFPAFNDSGTIASMVIRAVKAAWELTPDFEIIVVAGQRRRDGRNCRRARADLHSVQAIHYLINRGHGAAPWPPREPVMERPKVPSEIAEARDRQALPGELAGLHTSNRGVKITAMIVLAAITSSLASCRTERGPSVTVADVSSFVGGSEHFELSVRTDAMPRNPFIDVTFGAELIGPNGGKTAVPGFYYGGGRWMIRFRPRIPGRWTYSWDYSEGEAFRRQGGGSFQCDVARDDKGRIRVNPANVYRWTFDDG